MAQRNTAAKMPWISREPGERPKASRTSPFLPDEADLQSLLNLRAGDSIGDLIQAVLFEPIRNVTDRPGKRIRADLVRLGYELVAPFSHASALFRRHCLCAAEIVEFIHAGSLIVDDIEDGSKVRRGQPALHRQYGVPVALNAGNWLYFWPFQLIREMGLPKERELVFYRAYHATLLRAHFGQALDVGLKIDEIRQDRISKVCLSALELKTGALAGFAFMSGGILAGASEGLLSRMEEFGSGFGMTLQMFDDLGNLSDRAGPAKRFEDLALRRPSWVWACVARRCSRRRFLEFVSAVKHLPDETRLRDWLAANNLVQKGRQKAHEHLKDIYGNLDRGSVSARFDKKTLEELRALGQKVADAYD